jgi:hypothetical protein
MRHGFLALAAALVWLAPPVTAQDSDWEDSEQSDASAEAETAFFALDQRMSELFQIDRYEDAARRSAGFAALARDIAAARSRHAGVADWQGPFAEQEGTAWYYAAEANDYEPGDEAGEQQELAFLLAALAVLEPVMADKAEAVGPSYEYSNTTSDLAELGRARNDPRWPEWSASKVRAARFRVRVFPGDPVETSPLAEALYDHGWLTQDKAMLAEADRLAEAIPPEAAGADLDYKRQAVAAGEAPYLTPGTRSDW